MADTTEETVAEPVTPADMAKALRVDADRRLDCGLPLAASMLRTAADALDRQAAEITRLQAGGCARDQTTTQYCAEAAAFAAERDQLLQKLQELAKDVQEITVERDAAIEWAETAEADREALRAATAWRPIAEAPKTSQSRLVWCPAYRNTYVVSWMVPLGDDAKPRPEDGFWSHFGAGGSRLSERPTHWQPLPPPPAEG